MYSKRLYNMKLFKLGNEESDSDDHNDRGLLGRGDRARLASGGALLRPGHRGGEGRGQGEGVPLGSQGEYEGLFPFLYIIF